jgi:hypothetical protein
MPPQNPDFDVISQPAMPPPPPQPAEETQGLAKSANPRHNPPRLNSGRGEQR